MDITKLPLNELKSLGYDEITRLNVAQNNLRLLQEQISLRTDQESLKKTPKNDDNRKS